MIIAEIEARIKQIDEELAVCDAAQAGPWTTNYDGDGPGVLTAGSIKFGFVGVYGSMTDEDAEFIAAAREGYPRALRNERAALSGLIELFCYDCARDGCSDHKGRKCEGYVERGCECEAIP